MTTGPAASTRAMEGAPPKEHRTMWKIFAIYAVAMLIIAPYSGHDVKAPWWVSLISLAMLVGMVLMLLWAMGHSGGSTAYLDEPSYRRW